MVKAARHSNLLLGVAQVFRFERSTVTLRESLSALGWLASLLLRSQNPRFPVRSHRRFWITNNKIAGEGPIADVGVHCIDAPRYIVADEVVRVTTIGISDHASGDVRSHRSHLARVCAGTLASVLVSARAEYRTPFEIVGETWALQADDALS
jgi:predicted dehydrogenase